MLLPQTLEHGIKHLCIRPRNAMVLMQTYCLNSAYMPDSQKGVAIYMDACGEFDVMLRIAHSWHCKRILLGMAAQVEVPANLPGFSGPLCNGNAFVPGYASVKRLELQLVLARIGLVLCSTWGDPSTTHALSRMSWGADAVARGRPTLIDDIACRSNSSFFECQLDSAAATRLPTRQFPSLECLASY